jgi:hypothetical protein
MDSESKDGYELLPFTHIDTDLDRVVRVLLDVKLREFASWAGTNHKHYWARTLRFRYNWLISPSRRAEELKQYLEEQLPKESGERADRLSMPPIDPNVNQRINPFLYWFDVRAVYWASRSNVSTPPVDSKDLYKLFDQVSQLQKKVHQARGQKEADPNAPEVKWQAALAHLAHVIVHKKE